VPENLVDDRLFLDAGDHPGFTATPWADRHIDVEYPFQTLCPSHGLATLFGCFVLFRLRRITLPPPGVGRLTLYSVPTVEAAPNNPLVARRAGFSLHAATVCEAWQRSRLKRLCRYITRPPVATKRRSVDARGRVLRHYEQPLRHCLTHLLLVIFQFPSWPN
jgi:hypothetical protein